MSTALYRRYRPETFAEVIGQEHVTAPLSAAIDAGRINHAFLFSGPRGCGKTTSARILARCLNCAEGPTSTPCGQCESCRDLSNGGPGSLDVVEIDAASHNGVDDARDLRERAVYAPARDRYKVFILDEAHMVTPQGFNALLKLVEEPPAHVKFVFATTEPDKVIGTIRSRTHHYPFRLVPPETLGRYLEDLATREGVAVGAGVLPLVVRAGGGSVRDTLSVLDQLMAGATQEGIDYPTAVALLGYTDDSLLGDIVDAFSAGDGAGVFRVIDRVIESGHDPRRFVEDLLERFRDLFVISAAQDSAASFLPEVPQDRLERLMGQARAYGPAELSRAADLLNAGLTEMSGATSPRLQLELICARILLPGSEDSRRSVISRVDRLERRVGMTADGRMPAGAVPPAAAAPAAPLQTQGAPGQNAAPQAAQPGGSASAAQVPPGEGAPSGEAQNEDPFAGIADAMASARSVLDDRTPGRTADAPAAQERDAQESPVAAEPAPAAPTAQEQTPVQGPGQGRAHGQGQAPASAPPQAQEPVAREVRPQSPTHDRPAQQRPAEQRPAQEDAPPQGESQQGASQAGAPHQSAPAQAANAYGEAHASPEIRQAPGVGAEIDAIRRGWPDVLTRLQQLRKLSYAIVSGNAFPQSFADGVLALGFSNPGSVQAFRRGPHAQFVSTAVEQSLGIRAQVQVGDENAGPPPAQSDGPSPSQGPGSGRGSGGGPSSGAAGAGAAAAGAPAPGGPRAVTREQLDSVVGPREADREPVDHDRFWQSDSAQSREGSDDAEGDSPSSLTGPDTATPPQSAADAPEPAVAPEPSADSQTTTGESADPWAQSSDLPAWSTDAPTGDEAAGPGDNAATDPTSEASVAVESDAATEPRAAAEPTAASEADGAALTRWTPVPEPVETSAGEGAVDFGAVVVPPPVDIEPYGDEDGYGDDAPPPADDAYPGDPYGGDPHGGDPNGSDASGDQPSAAASPGDGLDFLGAYADVGIAFTDNPDTPAPSSAAAGSAVPDADSPLGRYARLAQRHSGDVRSAEPTPPPFEEPVPDPVENYADYDTEGDADIQASTDFGPAVVERILGGVMIEEIDE